MGSPCNCLSLRQATRRVTQLYDEALAPLELRATQYSLLREIARLGPVGLNALAEAMVMGRATLGHNVRPLEARGLVRIAIGADRRSREVSVTRAGDALLTEAHALWRRAQKTYEDGIGGAEAAALRIALHRVAEMKFTL
jgi:DNA-binding MarR family transcriptional regulator